MMELRIHDRVYIFVFLLLMITYWHLHHELKEVRDVTLHTIRLWSDLPVFSLVSLTLQPRLKPQVTNLMI